MFSPRESETTLRCPECGKNLNICRSCTRAFMRCAACKKEYPLKDFINRADKAMEYFLENVYFDRL